MTLGLNHQVHEGFVVISHGRRLHANSLAISLYFEAILDSTDLGASLIFNKFKIF